MLKLGKVNVLRFVVLKAICKVLNCKPSDILEYVEV
ncbi:helix-turn-helix domain-containing protein [Algibacter luteus]